MANAAIGFGSALLLLGIVGYTATGMHSPTALIPALFGMILIVAGLLARNPARRKTAMHVAAAAALLGIFGSAPGLIKTTQLMAGMPVERPNAAIAQAIMAVLCIVFTVLCVRSFIDARRNRTMETSR